MASNGDNNKKRGLPEIDASVTKTKMYKLTEFEDYNATSKVYDDTRVAVGTDAILGILATRRNTDTGKVRMPLDKMVLADFGCGTGNYTDVLSDYCGNVTGIELNPGMIEQACKKLEAKVAAGKVTLVQGSVTEKVPLATDSIDGVYSTQVVHHIETPETEAEGYTNLAKMIAEAARILKPGGVFILNTVSREQALKGYWWGHVIPGARDRYALKFAPNDVIAKHFEAAGLTAPRRIVHLDDYLQGEDYLDVEGPVKKTYRDGDSTWALATEVELEAGLMLHKERLANGTATQWMMDHQKVADCYGQHTFFYGIKK